MLLKLGSPAPEALWKELGPQFPQLRKLTSPAGSKPAAPSKAGLAPEGSSLRMVVIGTRPDDRFLGDELCRILLCNAKELGLAELGWNRAVWNASRRGLFSHSVKGAHDELQVTFTPDDSRKNAFPRTGLEVREL